MDISTRLIKANICGAMLFSLYFFTQTCGVSMRTLSLLLAIPLAKDTVDRTLLPVSVEDGCNYPVKKLLANFLKRDYGIWSVLLTELIRRMECYGAFNGLLSITLMCAWLMGYVFSSSTGICHTNVKNYRRGTAGFAIMSWLQIGVSLLMGSGWIMEVAFYCK